MSAQVDEWRAVLAARQLEPARQSRSGSAASSACACSRPSFTPGPRWRGGSPGGWARRRSRRARSAARAGTGRRAGGPVYRRARSRARSRVSPRRRGGCLSSSPQYARCAARLASSPRSRLGRSTTRLATSWLTIQSMPSGRNHGAAAGPPYCRKRFRGSFGIVRTTSAVQGRPSQRSAAVVSAVREISRVSGGSVSSSASRTGSGG